MDSKTSALRAFKRRLVAERKDIYGDMTTGELRLAVSGFYDAMKRHGLTRYLIDPNVDYSE